MKSIFVPKAVWFAGAAFSVLFSAGLLGYLNGRVFCFVWVASVAAGATGSRNPLLFLRSFYFLLPVVGFLSPYFKIPAFPLLLPFLWAGLLGIHWPWGRKRKDFSLPLPFAVYAISLMLSTVVGFWFFRDFYPDWGAVVSHPPWGPLFLKNALAWILLAFVTALSVIYLYGSCREHADAEALIVSLLGGVFVAAVFGGLQYLGYDFFSARSLYMVAEHRQFNGSFRDPNSMGTSVALLFPLWLALIERRRFSVWVWLIGPCLIFLLFIAGVRSAILIVAVSVVLLAGKIILNRSRFLMKILLAAVFVGAAVVFHQSQHQPAARFLRSFKLLSDSVDSGKIEAVLVGDRTHLWKAGWLTFKKYPVFGTGLGNYLAVMPRYEREIGKLANDNCANMYLQIAAEQGVIGLGAFLFLIGAVISQFMASGGIRRPFMEWAAASSVAGLLIAFFFGAHLLNFETNVLFSLLLSMISIDQRKG